MPVINIPAKQESGEPIGLTFDLNKQHQEMKSLQTEILNQLMILNTYMQLITNTQIKESDICK